MSDSDFVEASGDSFWEIGQYKRTVKRCEDGHKLCNDVVQMIAERADLEKAYSKNLKVWSKKWNDYLAKGSEYGSMKATWTSALCEADRLADIHASTHNALHEELNAEIKAWQKANYIKSIVNQIKLAKEYEEEFKKVQKPWGKKFKVVEKTKADYHAACKSYQTAKVQCSNSVSDSTLSPDQKKKLEDKVEKYKKEVEITKSKYKQGLDDLNSYNSRYIEDMNTVYKKCDQFEKERLEFFIQKFMKLQNCLNIYEKSNVNDIYSDFMNTIKQTNPDRDLAHWSKEFGSGMPMNWPVFEEYSEELKTIAKGPRASKMNKDINSDNNGVTMTSIKHKTNDTHDGAVDARSINLSAQDISNRNTTHSSNNSKESSANPFGDFDDDDDTAQATSKTTSSSKHYDDDSDEETAKAPPAQTVSIRVHALYDYISTEDDELSFKAGDEFIQLALEDDRGWCLGKLGTKVGLYPATYAEQKF